ncbi:MAG: hypothetical protein QOD76_660 [Solirubrobacteraceae bacterium]|jgi:hypothetical protein|nr:hypothetical protein [Solirubrobacteraceae bacterium]
MLARMTQSDLAVVVASVNGLPYTAECLAALDRYCPGAEVVLAEWTDAATRRLVHEQWPGVRLLSFDEPRSVPELRAAGIAATTAPYVAVIEDHCVVTEDWGRRILAAHTEGHSVVGGGVRNGATGRIRDWAAFLCEYGEHMHPAREGSVSSLPGMNVSHDRRALAALNGAIRTGYWEARAHPHLRRRGFSLRSDPSIVLEHVKRFGVREFVLQRFRFGREYAELRSAELGALRAIYLLASPLLVPLLYLRITRGVLRRRRHVRELLAATPLVLLYVLAWSCGEAVGYAFASGVRT